MEYYSRMAWIAVGQKFFEAYVNFRVEGTAKHWIEHNDRKIEISFLITVIINHVLWYIKDDGLFIYNA